MAFKLVAFAAVFALASAQLEFELDSKFNLDYKPDDPNVKFPKIRNEYIVVMSAASEHRANLESHLTEVASHDDATINHNYHIKNQENPDKEFIGYHLIVTDEETSAALKYVQSRVGLEVKYVEKNSVVKHSRIGESKPSCDSQSGATWGITRTVSRANKAGATDYSYNAALQGEGVVAYIIDTGIATENVDFEGRATWGADFANTPSPGTDQNGHGTHVASTVCGVTFGLAKKATCVGVAVLSSSGSGTMAGVIAGVDWSIKNSEETGKKGKSVGNMSLGGGNSAALDDAVNAGHEAGFPMVTAAGNESTDGCSSSPGAAKNAFNVMSTTRSDSMSGFSNFGKCTDIAAPGSDITAAWVGSNIATRTISGTSMAAPHVAGVAAKILSSGDFTPDSLFKEILDLATPDLIQNLGRDSPNLLLFKDCESGIPPAPTPPTPPPTPPPPTPPTPAPTKAPTYACSAVPARERYPCGGRTYVSEAACASAPGNCCWSQDPITAIWCYDAPASGSANSTLIADM
jgi:subtilisin family serine protease